MVKILRRKFKERSVPDLTLNKVRNWIINGNLDSTKSGFQHINKRLLYSVCSMYPDRIRQFLFDSLKENKTNLPSLITLSVLSSNNVPSKKVFYEMFPKIISSIKNLLEFYYHIKKDHGITKRVRKTIIIWIERNYILLKKECDKKTIYKDVDVSMIMKDYKMKAKTKKETETYNILMSVGTTTPENNIFTKTTEIDFISKIREWNKKQLAI